ncbi:MAG: hypothetical protein A2539_03555 [Elusimicrobia bacterium RIFOXYD2_FULL_34_15]|nr:MAG: hypothetical protein A2539_03555 [Elusimicrobia bacterium RIFOXYD2_FULL_34_15]
MKNLRILIISLIIITFLTDIKYCVGSTSSEFLLLPKSARVAAIAGAFTAVADDSNSIFYNPAGMSFIKQNDISFTHSSWLESINFENISCVLPLKNKYSIGFGIEYLGINGIKGKESQLSPIREYSSYDISPALGVSYLLNKRFSFGINTRYIEEKIDDIKAKSVGMDIGCLYKQKINSFKTLSMGLSITNINIKKQKFIEKEENLPTKITIGIAYKPLGDTLLISSDLTTIRGSKPLVNTGMELLMYNVLNLRAGYKLDPAYETGSRISLGLGFAIKSLSFDYSYLPFESLSNPHVFSIRYKFN